MSRGPDVIRWVIDWMLANDDSINQELALRCEREARREWGGQEVGYIAKTCAADREQRRALQGRTPASTERAAVADYLSNRPIDQVVEAHGISRRTLYRMIKR